MGGKKKDVTRKEAKSEMIGNTGLRTGGGHQRKNK